MPVIAIRTLSFEKVRVDLKVIRFAIKAARFKLKWILCTLAKMQIFILRRFN